MAGYNHSATSAKHINYRLIAAGIIFAIFWSSAAAATKIALQSAQPFAVAIPRFFVAAFIMLFVAHMFFKNAYLQEKSGSNLPFMACSTSAFILDCMLLPYNTHQQGLVRFLLPLTRY